MNESLELNKKNVMAFYDLMFNQCKPAEAIEKYAGAVYIQHNLALDLLEHEAAHHGQLIRYLYGLKLEIPPGWKSKYALN